MGSTPHPWGGAMSVSFLESIDFPAIASYVLIAFLTVTAVMAIDDLLIDFVALAAKLRPKRLSSQKLSEWQALPEKRIAILVANWQEADVLDRMLRGNLSRIDYRNYFFFVGVYPNDPLTIAAAELVAKENSRIVVVQNPRPGPTTKGQMLNVIFEKIFEIETQIGSEFDCFVMQDSEDVLHPHSLRAYNVAAEKSDFIQIPVFSFVRGLNQWVASTYMDEFAELHTKDLLVRDHMKAGVPSAGVGTALSRRLVLRLMAHQNGLVLREDSLTEDYILGLTVPRLGLSSSFECHYLPIVTIDGREMGRDFIATREFFPSSFSRAVRQKGRWVHGIVLQGQRILPFAGSLAQKYFLWRDRKGPLASIVGVLGMALFVSGAGSALLWPSLFDEHLWPQIQSLPIQILFAFNLFAGIWRAGFRYRAVQMVYSPGIAMISILRLPLTNILNFAAFARAFQQDRISIATGQAPAWTKTTHELPKDFGVIGPANEPAPQSTRQPEPQVNR